MSIRKAAVGLVENGAYETPYGTIVRSAIPMPRGRNKGKMMMRLNIRKSKKLGEAIEKYKHEKKKD